MRAASHGALGALWGPFSSAIRNRNEQQPISISLHLQPTMQMRETERGFERG